MYCGFRSVIPGREVCAKRSTRRAYVIPTNFLIRLPLTSVLVLSLFGVVLIARPPFLFGTGSNGTGVPLTEEVTDSPARIVTPEQRLIAVGYICVIRPVIRIVNFNLEWPSLAYWVQLELVGSNLFPCVVG